MSYIDVDDYQPTPHNPAEDADDLRLAIRWLWDEIDVLEAALTARERELSRLLGGL